MKTAISKVKWQIPCKEWLDILQNEIKEVKAVNDIAHYVKNITINNPNLSYNDFLWWIDDSFVKNAIVRLSRILEQKSERFKDTISFEVFLITLKDDLSCIKTEEEFIKSSIINFHCSNDQELEDYKNRIKSEYIELTQGKSKENNITEDLDKIEEYRKKFSGFRNYEVGHLKANKDYNDIEYKDITEAIEFLENLIRKYIRLITAPNPPRGIPYNYGNVFDIPWRLQEEAKVQIKYTL